MNAENKPSLSMRLFTIQATPKQRLNAIGFLRRVPLKGDEAKALVEVMNLFINAEQAADPEAQPQPGVNDNAHIDPATAS
jgi:hypothetical protein